MADDTCHRRLSTTLTSLRIFGVVIAMGMASILLFLTYTDQNRVLLEYAGDAPSAAAGLTEVKGSLKDVLPAVNVTSRPPWDYNWDKKAWSSPEESRGVPDRTVILIRHGQYDAVTGALTEKGRQQANLTGLRLKQLNMGYDNIFHSSLLRAKQTADLIHAHLSTVPMTSDDLLCEGGPLPPLPTLGYWSLPERTYHMDGPRLEAAFRKYFHRLAKAQPQVKEILVGHGNIFRFFTLRALQLPPEAWMRIFLPHGSITLMHLNSDSTVTLTKFGDSGHFPPELVTI